MLDTRQTFETFTIGPANQLAAAAARSAAQAPATAYNPLVLYGPGGAGKTHLLTAMAHLARAVHDGIVAHYEEVNSFIDRLTTAITADTLDEFQSALGQLDLLILDDFQEISGKGRSQQELVQIWDQLIKRGGQIVLAADRPPQDIPGLDQDLIRRLADGLAVDMAPVEGQASGKAEPADTENEFSDFLSDVSSTVAAVVDAAPWRKALAQAILRWEGEGIRTRRLEQALEADSAPDLDALLSRFAEDVRRLRQVAADIHDLTPADLDPAVLQDPDRLPELEKLLLEKRPVVRRPGPHAVSSEPALANSANPEPHPEVDSWFFQSDRLDLHWVALDDRILEEMS